ncbi:MAG: SagB/ThcOx family dehydrogenase [Spirochaetota bacterium]
MDSIGRTFIEKTKHRHLSVSDQSRGAAPPSLEDEYDPSGKIIDLPSPRECTVSSEDVRTLIERRQSIREYAARPISRGELSYLLWATQGVKEIYDAYITLRTVPSAGARHAFETYLLLNRVEGIAPGLYRYLAIEHKLILVSARNTLQQEIMRSCFSQTMIRDAAAVFIWAANIYRMAWRYSERAYRYVFLDAGHVCQNLYLASESIGCGVCALAAYDDDGLNAILGLDGEEKFAIYLATVGKKKEM